MSEQIRLQMLNCIDKIYKQTTETFAIALCVYGKSTKKQRQAATTQTILFFE